MKQRSSRASLLHPSPPSLLLLNPKPYKQDLFNTTNLKKHNESLITLSLHLSICAKRVEINEILTMKQRTGRALLLRPLTFFSFPTLTFFFSNYYDISGLIFVSYRGQTTRCRGPRRLHNLTALGHGGWPSRPLGPRSLGQPPWFMAGVVRHDVWWLV
jgi:hypothetical protein